MTADPIIISVLRHLVNLRTGNDAPFFSETVLYDLIGRDNARNLLGRVKQLCQVAGTGLHTLQSQPTDDRYAYEYMHYEPVPDIDERSTAQELDRALWIAAINVERATEQLKRVLNVKVTLALHRERQRKLTEPGDFEFERLTSELNSKRLRLAREGEEGRDYHYHNSQGGIDIVQVVNLPLSDREAEQTWN